MMKAAPATLAISTKSASSRKTRALPATVGWRGLSCSSPHIMQLIIRKATMAPSSGSHA
jgi:hypothetical protein